MEATNQEITLAEPVCVKLKHIYFDGMNWIECYRNVASRLTQLKSIVSRLYPDKTRVQVLQEIIKYTNDDIIDAFELFSE